MSAESQLLALILTELRQLNERHEKLEQLLEPHIHPPAPSADAALSSSTTPKRRAKKAK